MAQVDATGNVVSAPAPTLNLNTPPPDTQFLGGSVSQLPGYVPPDSGRVLQPWQVEDRNSYLQAQKMIAQQNAQQMAAAQQQMAIQQYTGGNPGGISNDLSSAQVSPAMSQQDATNLLSYLASKRLYGNSQAERDYYDRAYKNVTSQLPSAIVSQAENDIRHNKAITGNEFALGDILNRNIGGLAQAGGAAGKFLAPITLGPANLIPGVTGIAQTVGQKVGELAGPGLADIGTGGALTGPFTLQAGQQAIQISRAYEQGQISGKDALLGLAQTAPQLIPALLHGGGKLAEFARSDEGQTALQGALRPPNVAYAMPSESGSESAPRPVGDNSPAPPQAGGVQPNPFEERINRPANQPGGVGVTLSPAVAEFVQGLAESKYLTGTARAVKLKESLGTVASRMENAKLQAISEGKSPAEVAAAVSAARAGARLPEFQPGERLANFTGWKDLHAQGLSANLAGEIDNHQLANFHGILNDIQDPPEGYKGPQPHQAKLLGQVLGPAVEKALPAGPKAWSAYAELRSALGLLPTLKTSLSAHGPFNQLWRVAPGHPFIWLEQSANDLRRFVASPETRAAEWAKIQQDPFITGEGLPYGAGANEGNVRLKQFGPSNLPENLPEEMQAFGQNTVTSRLVNKIPLLTRSKEAYTLTMDAARLALYKSQVQPLLKMVANGEIVPPDRFDAIKQLVNEETGWGNTGEAKPELAPGVPLFFSVHNLVSKPQWVFQMFNKDPVVRAAAIKDVLAFAGFSSAVLGGLKASGAASVNLNPWGSFGDIQVGNVHVNPVRDFAPIIKLIAQVTTPAHLRPTVGGDLPTTRDWRQAIATYARGALGPGASVAADVATGQNYIGQPLGLNAKTVRTEAWDAASPIFINELVEAAKNNQPFSYAMLPYAFGGGSLNIYGPQAGSKASLMQALGLPANATPQQILLAEQKNPQALQDYLNVKKQQSNDFGTYAAASQKALADQQRIDQQFQSGAVNAQQWKDAYHTIQDNLGYLRETLPGLKSANGAAQPKVVSDYYAIYDKYPNAKTDPAQQQQLNDALDQYTANLSASDQKVFDQYVGFGAGTTPLVREYRDTVKGLQKAGIYGVEQKILGQAGIPAQFKSVSDLVNYTVDQIMQSLPQGQRSPALRQLIVNKVSPHFNKLDELVNLSKLALVSGNPQLEAEAVKFGLMQTKAALALSLATSQGSGQ